MANAMSARAAFLRHEIVKGIDVLVDDALGNTVTTVSSFPDPARTLRTLDEAFTRPCVMMSARQFDLGEYGDVLDPVFGKYARRHVILAPMMGWLSYRIANPVLSDGTRTRSHLSPYVASLFSPEFCGEARGDDERCLVMIDEFTPYTNEPAKAAA